MTEPVFTPRVADIVRIVAEDYGVTIFEILSPRKTAPLADARHTAVYLGRTLANQSLPQLGRHFERDHTTLLPAINKIASRILIDDVFAARVKRLALEAQRLADPAVRAIEERDRRAAAAAVREADAARRRMEYQARIRRERTARVLTLLPVASSDKQRDALIAEAVTLDPRFSELGRRHAYARQVAFTMGEREAHAAVLREIARLSKSFAESARG